MDDINLFSLITVLSFLLSCPLMLLAEGVKFSPAYLQSTVSLSLSAKFRQAHHWTVASQLLFKIKL
jgi:hypothetical protein